MHSQIYQITDEPLDWEDWADELEISNEHGEIEGVDYHGIIHDAQERVEFIQNFFLKWFPDKSFEIEGNEPGQPASVKFVGDIGALYEKWRKQIQDAANDLSTENMTGLGVFHVRMACEKPFGLSSKFYIPNWNGCTTSADDFMDYLRIRSKEANGEPFRFYVGQVFDYHF